MAAAERVAAEISIASYKRGADTAHTNVVQLY